MASENSEAPTRTLPTYRVLAVPHGASREEQVLGTFHLSFEAAAFAKLLRSGGRYVSVRIERPPSHAGSGERTGHHNPPSSVDRPGGLHKLLYFLYASSIFIGALASLGVGFLAAILFAAWFVEATGTLMGPPTVVGLAVVIAAGLTSVVIKIHILVFRQRKPK